MAKITQHQPQINNQVIADNVDLRGAWLGAARPEVGDVRLELERVLTAMRSVADSGQLDAKAAAVVEASIAEAQDRITAGDDTSAKNAVRKAVETLQSVAPVAAIAGTLFTIWRALAGGA